jgi:hypothetical protein
MLHSAALALIIGLSGRFAGTCRHIALVKSLRFFVAPLQRATGHSGKGSSAGFGLVYVPTLANTGFYSETFFNVE